MEIPVLPVCIVVNRPYSDKMDSGIVLLWLHIKVRFRANLSDGLLLTASWSLRF